MVDTMVISGASPIDDSDMFAGNTTMNGGGAAGALTVHKNASIGVGRALIRLKKDSLPAGPITAFRIIVTRPNNTVTVAPINFYRVKDANVWNEGTKSWTAAGTGDVCWAYRQYNTLTWVGSAGCSTDGTDYFSDASPPSVTMTDQFVQYPVNLPAQWATDWRDSTVVDNGLLVKSTDEVNTRYGSFIFTSEYSTPASFATNFQVDYEVSTKKRNKVVLFKNFM